MMTLPISDIRVDPELQLREGKVNKARVGAMIEFEEEGGHLPPITVVGDDNLLADGHHRLDAALRMGRTEIDVERVPGGKAEAVALAIQRNDIATLLGLSRTERNAGVKLLLKEAWTQEKIATTTGVSQHTISNIANSLAARGTLPKRSSGLGAGRPSKAVAALPPEAHKRLNDTVLVRIAELPVGQQVEFATAVAAVPNKKDPTKTGLSEPRIREAIKAVKAGRSIAEAIEEVTPGGSPVPKTLPDVAGQVRRRLERFLTEPMTVMEVERDFWQVLDVLAANANLIPLEARGLANLLADVSVRAELYASRLRNGQLVEVTA